MLRVFLVIDDYNELIYLQSLLKKLGLDVEGVQNQKKYADMSLGFNPHILITSAKGKKVDGLQLTQSLYRKRGLPKVIALKSSEYAINEDDYRDSGVDEILDSPVNPRKLILSIANLGGVDETALLEKYSKIKGQMAEAAQDQGYTATYDENGQPVEHLQKVKQSLETVTKVPGFPLDSSGNPYINDPSGSFEGGSGEKPRFPLQGQSTGEPGGANATGSSDAGQGEPGGWNAHSSFDPSDPSAAAQSANSSAHGASDNIYAGGETSSSTVALQPREKTEREKAYDSWATSKVGPLPPKHFVRDRILDFNKKIRMNNVVEDIDQIEDERKTFVKTLFRRSKP